jgi:hypothetical protein
MRVTFKCDHATSLDLIRAVGFQTRIPIGIVLGQNPDSLSKATHRYELENADAWSALLKAIEGTGYSIKDQNHVVVIIAGDLTPRQEDLLLHQYSNFAADGHSYQMKCWGMVLTGWLRDAAHPGAGFGFSCPTSTNEEQFKLDIAPLATTEEIANQIVSMGSKGMWTFKVSAALPVKPTEEVDVLPYQHYSNRAIDQHSDAAHRG